MSKTKLGPGVHEAAAPDTAALATLDEDTSMGFPSGMTGDHRLKIDPSQMGITYGVGGLCEAGHPIGSLVLDKTDKILDKNQELICVVTKVHKYWKQREGIGGAYPVGYANKQEAQAAGEVTDWPPYGSDGPKPTVSEALTLSMLVRQPKGCVSSKFILVLDNEVYAPVTFFADKQIAKDAEPFLDRLQILDSQKRKVPLAEGKHSECFLTMKIYSQKNRGGREVTRLQLANLAKDGLPVPVTEAFWADLNALFTGMSGTPTVSKDMEDADLADLGEI